MGSSFSLDFNSGYACRVDPSFSEAPTLGYGQTEGVAAANAINNCMAETGHNRMHCDDVACAPVSFDGGRPTVSIVSRDGTIGVYFSTGSQSTCVVDAAFGEGMFIAEAPTQMEAEVYAQRLCMGQTGNARMHCDDVVSCEQTSGVSVGATDVKETVKDVFGGLFKKKKN